MTVEYGHWDEVWKSQKYISDYMLRWYGYLENVSRGLLPAKRDILEVGSGSGAGIAIFARDGHRSSGLDISKVAIERSSSRYREVKFFYNDLFAMPFEDNRFDLVFNSGVIEHFLYPKNIDALRAMERVLRPGGRLIVSVPNKLCWWYTIGKKILIKIKRWPYGFEDGYSPALLKRYIGEVNNLRLNRIFGMQALPMLALPNFELIPLPLRKAVAKIENILPLKKYYSFAIIAECTKIK